MLLVPGDLPVGAVETGYIFTQRGGDQNQGNVALFRDGSLAYWQYFDTIAGATSRPERLRLPASSISFFDLPSAGSHTYSIQMGSGWTDQQAKAGVHNVKLVAFEL